MQVTADFWLINIKQFNIIDILIYSYCKTAKGKEKYCLIYYETNWLYEYLRKTMRIAYKWRITITLLVLWFSRLRKWWYAPVVEK